MTKKSLFPCVTFDEEIKVNIVYFIGEILQHDREQALRVIFKKTNEKDFNADVVDFFSTVMDKDLSSHVLTRKQCDT